MTILLGFIFFAVVAQRLLELRLAERNRKAALARGGVEYGANHYLLFVVLHSLWLASWAAEGWLRARDGNSWSEDDMGSIVLTVASLMVFLLAEALRYWAIFSLKESWNTRIIVVPGAKIVREGAYRFFKHPNYIAVAIELAAVPLIFGAWKTALWASLANAALLLFIRIPAENKAVREHLS
jgi:methyltransferase